MPAGPAISLVPATSFKAAVGAGRLPPRAQHIHRLPRGPHNCRLKTSAACLLGFAAPAPFNIIIRLPAATFYGPGAAAQPGPTLRSRPLRLSVCLFYAMEMTPPLSSLSCSILLLPFHRRPLVPCVCAHPSSAWVLFLAKGALFLVCLTGTWQAPPPCKPCSRALPPTPTGVCNAATLGGRSAAGRLGLQQCATPAPVRTHPPCPAPPSLPFFSQVNALGPY